MLKALWDSSMVWAFVDNIGFRFVFPKPRPCNVACKLLFAISDAHSHIDLKLSLPLDNLGILQLDLGQFLLQSAQLGPQLAKKHFGLRKFSSKSLLFPGNLNIPLQFLIVPKEKHFIFLYLLTVFQQVLNLRVQRFELLFVHFLDAFKPDYVRFLQLFLSVLSDVQLLLVSLKVLVRDRWIAFVFVLRAFCLFGFLIVMQLPFITQIQILSLCPYLLRRSQSPNLFLLTTPIVILVLLILIDQIAEVFPKIGHRGGSKFMFNWLGSRFLFFLESFHLLFGLVEDSLCPLYFEQGIVG